MSRPLLLVFLLLILIITSQFEWRQQLVVDLDTAPTVNQKQHQISKREEVVKEKVISLVLLNLFVSFCNEVYFRMRLLAVALNLHKMLQVVALIESGILFMLLLLDILAHIYLHLSIGNFVSNSLTLIMKK